MKLGSRLTSLSSSKNPFLSPHELPVNFGVERLADNLLDRLSRAV